MRLLGITVRRSGDTLHGSRKIGVYIGNWLELLLSRKQLLMFKQGELYEWSADIVIRLGSGGFRIYGIVETAPVWLRVLRIVVGICRD